MFDMSLATTPKDCNCSAVSDVEGRPPEPPPREPPRPAIAISVV